MNDEMVDRIAKALRELHLRTIKSKRDEHLLLWTQFKSRYPDKAYKLFSQVENMLAAIGLANYVVAQPKDIVPQKKVVRLTPQQEVPPTVVKRPKVRRPMIIKRELQKQDERPRKK